MNLMTLRILDKVKSYDISEEQYKLIDEAIDEEFVGNKYLFRLKTGEVIIIRKEYHYEEEGFISIEKINKKKLKLPAYCILGSFITYDFDKDLLFCAVAFFNDINSEYGGNLIEHDYLKGNKDITRESQLNQFLQDILCQMQGFEFYSDYLSSIFAIIDSEPVDDEEIMRNAAEWYLRFAETDESPEIQKILKVIQKDNMRLIIATATDDEHLYFYYATPENAEYNFLDEGRRFYRQLYLEDDIKEISIREAKVLAEMHKNPRRIFASDLMDPEVQTRVALENQRLETEQREEGLNKKDEERKQKLLDQGTGEIDGIIFSKNKITFNDQVLSGIKTKAFLEKTGYHPTRIDFQKIFSDYLNHVHNYVLSGRNFQGRLGKCDVRIIKRKNYIRLNDRKIIKKDFLRVLINIKIMLNTGQYERYLDTINGISLETKEMLDNGIIISLNEIDPESETGIENLKKIMLKIIKCKKGYYLKSANRRHKIKKITDFALLYRQFNNTEREPLRFEPFVEIIKTALELNENEIVNVVLDSMQKYDNYYKEKLRIRKNRTRRSRAFLKKTIELTKAEKTDKGYLVNGVSGRKYLIQKDASCYRLKGKDAYHICIENKERNLDKKDKSLMNDEVAARLHILNKDTHFAGEIRTIGLEA